jgi:methylated-DNA-[protein]-cysteine S-methyltransferase
MFGAKLSKHLQPRKRKETMLSRSAKPPIPEGPLFVFPSGLGWFAVAWRAERLQALAFGYASGAEAAGALAPPASCGRQGEVAWRDLARNARLAGRDVCRLAERLQAYADGGRDDFLDIPLAEPPGSEFLRKVLEQCRRIGYGQTCSYGQLAARAGHPRAARAVGRVMAANRVPLVVPCHRVLGSTGSLHGYSGCGGLAMKRRLLALEGVFEKAGTKPGRAS